MFLALVSSSWGSHGVVIYMYIKYIHIQCVYIYIYASLSAVSFQRSEYRWIQNALGARPGEKDFLYPLRHGRVAHLRQDTLTPSHLCQHLPRKKCYTASMERMRALCYEIYETWSISILFDFWPMKCANFTSGFHPTPTGPTDWFIMVDTDLPPRYNLW